MIIFQLWHPRPLTDLVLLVLERGLLAGDLLLLLADARLDLLLLALVVDHLQGWESMIHKILISEPEPRYRICI